MEEEAFSEPIKFKGVIQLLKESWRIYLSKIGILLGIMTIPIGFGLIGDFIISSLSAPPIGYSIWFSIIWAIIYLASIFFNWLALPTLIYSIKENIGLREAYKRGLKIFISFALVFILLNLIILGGFLIFIIPGFIFTIWFSLAIYPLVCEERKGMGALFRSQHLVSGKFWGVLGRFLGFGLIIIVSLLIILIVFSFFLSQFVIGDKQIEDFGQIFGQIFAYFILLFIFPLVLIYGFLIYQNLTELKKEIPFYKPSLKSKLKYLLPGFLGLLIWGAIISFTFLNIFGGRDEPPPDDSDLRLSAIDIPKGENAYFPLVKASEKIYWPGEKTELINNILEGKKWDIEFVEELLKKNKETLIYFDQALERPQFQDPNLQEPETLWLETPLSARVGLRNIANLNLIKAIHLFKEDKQKEAIDEIIKVIQLGQLMEDSPRGILIDYLIGMAIKGKGLEVLRTVLPEIDFSPEELRNYIVKLERFKLNEEGLKRVLKMEYISTMNTKERFDAIFRGQLSKEELKELEIEPLFSERLIRRSNFYYKPNQTQRIFTEHFRREIHNVKDYCGQMESYEIKLLTPPTLPQRLLTENLVGKLLYDIGVVAFPGLSQRKCLEDFSVVGTQILLALKAYKTETGELPRNLSELVPKYFSEIPKDPFNGKPIRYSPEKKIIYSVGKDLKDSGGSEGEDWQTMPDPTFKIEF